MISFASKKKAASAAFFYYVSTRLAYLGWVIFVASWLAYDHYRPWVNFHSEALALTGVTTLFLAALAAKIRNVRLPLTGATLLIVAGLPWLQVPFGPAEFAGDAAMASIYLVALAVSMVVGFNASQMSQSPRHVPAVFFALAMAGVCSAVVGLIQWLVLQEALGMYFVQSDVGDRAMGNLGQPNQLATLLIMAVVSMAFLHEQKAARKFTFALLATLLTGVLLMTESRAGLLSCVVIAAFLCWKRKQGHIALRIPLILTWVVLVVVLSRWIGSVHEFLMIGSGRGISLMDSNSRWLLWSQVVSGIAQQPWAGYGWNQMTAAHAAGALNHPGSLTYTNAHNIVLDLMAWTGVPVGAALTGLLAYWVVTRTRQIERPVAIYAMACLLAIGVHSLFEYPFAYAYFLVAAGFLAGVVESTLPQRKTWSLSRAWASSLVGVWIVLGVLIVRDYLLVETDFQVVRYENLRIGQTSTDYVRPQIFVLSQLGAMLSASRLRPVRGMSPEDIELLRKVTMRFSYGTLHLRYALSLGLNGESAEASRQMRIIRSMYGDFYYSAARAVLRSTEAEGYPELALVKTP